MQRKEAEDIAWEIYRFEQAVEEVTGIDTAMLLANTAIDMVDNIVKRHPAIKRELEKWKEPTP